MPGRIAGMTRYKGVRSPRIIAAEFPHAVELLVPEGGFGNMLNQMHLMMAQLGVEAVRGVGRRMNDRNYIVWRFADQAHARSFAETFGGVVLDETKKPRR
jgi:hypothetical protein